VVVAAAGTVESFAAPDLLHGNAFNPISRLLGERFMFSTSVARRAAVAATGAGAIAGVMFFGSVPSALADPPPAPLGCSAADFEQVKGDVATATAGYFFTHPDVNAFFSSLKGQPRDQIDRQVKDYYAANPQVQSEMAGVRQPMRDFKARCQ